MPIKTILAVLHGDAGDRVRLDAALTVARRFDAHIDALHARHDRRDAIPVMGDGLTGGMLEEMILAAEQEITDRSRTAHAAFESWVSDNNVAIAGAAGSVAGVSSTLFEDTGRADDLVGIYGKLVDLIVVGRAADPDDVTAARAVEAAISSTGRLVLLAPPQGMTAIGRNVAIFWNGSPQAARAISGAVPFLSGAESVNVLSVVEPRVAGVVQRDLPRYLAWHGVSALTHQLSPSSSGDGEALLSEAMRLGANLLVMGAYSRSRLKRIVFGGVTTHVLANATMPVLMAR